MSALHQRQCGQAPIVPGGGSGTSSVITPDLTTGTIVNGIDVTGVATATAFTVTVVSGALVNANSELTLTWPTGATTQAEITFRCAHTHAGAGNTVGKLTINFGGAAIGTSWPLVNDDQGNTTMSGAWPGTPLGQSPPAPRSTTWVRVIVTPISAEVYASATANFDGPFYAAPGSNVLVNNAAVPASIATLQFAGEQRTATADATSTVTIDNVTIRPL